ncbi:hypothetical protein Tco_1571608 [Tanacetum coccineum]
MTSMFQQHQDETLSEAWTRFKDFLQKVPHHGIDLWLQVQIFYDHVNPATRCTIDQSAGDFNISKIYEFHPKDEVEDENSRTNILIDESHGEDVESHPHSQETWNEVTLVKKGNTHGVGKSSDPIFMLTGIPSTPHAATSYPLDAVLQLFANGVCCDCSSVKVDVLQKSFEELKEARARVKELFEEAI